MEEGYLTSGQVARLLGVSKRTVLRAAARGELRVAHRMPGGAQRFLVADVDRYARLLAARQPPTRPAARTARGAVDAGLTRLAHLAPAGRDGVQSLVADTLALLADSLQVGATCLARAGEDGWTIEQIHDRMGLLLRRGDPLPGGRVVGAALRDGRIPALLVADMRKDARFAAAGVAPPAGLAALSAVALRGPGGAAWGALCILHPYPRAVRSEEIALLQVAGQIITQAEEMAALRRAEQRSARRLALQYAAATTLAGVATFEEAAPALLRVIAAHLGWDIGECWRPDPERRTLRRWARWDREAEEQAANADPGPSLAPGEGWLGRAWASGDPIWVADLAAEPARVEGGGAWARMRAALALPVRAAGEVQAILLLLSREAQQPNRETRQALVAVAAQAGQFLERIGGEETRTRLAAIVASSSEAIIGKSLAGRIESWNAGATRLYGYTAAEAIGRPIAMLAPPDRPDEIPALLERIRRGEGVAGVETQRRRKDGSLVDVALSISPIRDGAGRVIGAATIARDITEPLRARRETERARAAAEELARIRSDFLAAVSHELRTPLTVVVGIADLLQAHWDKIGEARKLERVGQIARAASRQKRLVEDLLLANRLDVAGVAVAPVEASLEALVRQAAEEVRATYAGQRIAIEGPGEVRVRVDPIRAIQVLTNVLDNAAKYSPDGSPVAVSWATEGSMAAVRVRDRGPGIPEGGGEWLFTRFGRIPGSRTRAGHVGTGLGLFISRGLATAMGGDLDLEATGPEGSIFRLRLPIVEMTRQAGAQGGA